MSVEALYVLIGIDWYRLDCVPRLVIIQNWSSLEVQKLIRIYCKYVHNE